MRLEVRHRGDAHTGKHNRRGESHVRAMRNSLDHRSTPSSGARRLVTLLLSGLLTVGVLAGPAHSAAPSSGPSSGNKAPHTPHGLRVPADFFGLHDGSTRSYDHLTFGSVRFWDAGVTWKDVETAPGVYSWARLDSLVSAAQRHGVEATMVLAMTPSFYASSATLPPTHLSHYTDFVRAVMTRYRHFNGSRGIDAFKVWNEGNVPCFWTGMPHRLAQLTRIVDRVRDQVDPGAQVVAPSFAVRLPYQQRWLADYESQRVGGSPVWRYVDANALSLYPQATYHGRIGGPEDAMRLLSQVRRRLAHVGVPAGLPIQATEVNYGLASGGPVGAAAATPISEKRQVANVLRTFLLGAARRLTKVFWYRYDWSYVPSSGGTLGNTLLTTPGQWDQVTPAGQAVDTARRWLHGRLVGVGGHRPCAANSVGTYTCVVSWSGGRRTIMWNPTHRVDVDVRGASYVKRPGHPRTAVDGRAASIPVGYLPVVVVRAR